jgi:hypothetical protein
MVAVGKICGVAVAAEVGEGLEVGVKLVEFPE